MSQTPLSQPSTDNSKSAGFSPKLLLKVIFSIALLTVLFYRVKPDKILHELAHANLNYIPIGIALYLFGQLVSAYRWKFLSAALQFQLSLREFYDYYLIGMFFSLFLPGAIGGDMLRMYYLAKRTQRKKREAILTLLAERGVGLIALLMLITVVCLLPGFAHLDLSIPLHLPFMKQTVLFDLKKILLSLSSLMLGGYLLAWLLPLAELAARFPALNLILQARVYWANLPLLLKSISISLSVHSLMILIHLLIASALHIDINPLYLTVVYGVVSLASVLPIAFNGFGVREGTYWFLLTKVGVSAETAIAFAVYWDIISTFTSLIGGVILLRGHYQTPAPNEAYIPEPD